MADRIRGYKSYRRALNPTGHKYLSDRQKRFNKKHEDVWRRGLERANEVKPRLSNEEIGRKLNEARIDHTLDYVSVYLANVFLKGLGADVVVSKPMETKSFFALCQMLGYTRKDFEWIVNQPINYLRNKEERKFLADRLEKWWPTKNTP